MIVLDIVSALLLAGALFFFVAGAVALCRFPDLYTRLHALTKADNVGLGLTVIALALQAESLREVLTLVLLWTVVLVTSATVCLVIGSEAVARALKPWVFVNEDLPATSSQLERSDGC